MTKEKLKLTHIPLVSGPPVSHVVQQLTPLALKKTQLNQYEGGDWADKLLALQLWGKEVERTVMSTKKEGGDRVYAPDKVNPEFYKFYKSLDTVNSTPPAKIWWRGKHSFYWKIDIYKKKFAATTFACLQSMVGFSRNHFWCLQVKKKNCCHKL